MPRAHSMFKGSPNIIPPPLSRGMTITDIVNTFGQTCFEARNVCRAARLFKRMIDHGDVIWLGVAGAGIA
ncbi:MAG: hypothetical protein PVF99_12165, partial [Desulfobacterales bacterium]